MTYTVRDFKRGNTEYGYAWVSKDEKYFIEKEYGKFYIFRLFGSAYDAEGNISYDNVEGGSDCKLPRPTTLRELCEFLNNTEEVERLYKEIDAE